MLVESFGFLASTVSILGWGSYFVPMKKVGKFEPFCFQALMCTGIFLSSLFIVVVFDSFRFNTFGFISGFLWAFTNILAIVAVEKTGLARSAPIWMGCGILVSFLWGLIYFQEQLTSILLGTIGITSLIVGISLISLTGGKEEKSDVNGVAAAVIAGIIGGTYLVPLKMSKLKPPEFLFPMSVGILITSWMIYFIKQARVDRKVIPFAFASGLIWNIANFSSFFAVLYLGISIGFPLTQTALLVSVLWGLFYFKETTGRNKILKIIVGAIILLLGAVFLASAK